MSPETSSVLLGIGEFLYALVLAILSWLAIITVGGALAAGVIYLNKGFPFQKAAALGPGAGDQPLQANSPECIDALKLRLAAMNKTAWLGLVALGIGFFATSPQASQWNLPGSGTPVRQLGLMLFAIYLASVTYYLAMIFSIDRLFKTAADKPDFKLQLSSRSGFLSPFSESATLSGNAQDVLGFAVLTAGWLAALELQGRVFASSEWVTFAGKFVPYQHWIVSAVFLVVLSALQRAAERYSSSKILYYVKLGCLGAMMASIFFWLSGK